MKKYLPGIGLYLLMVAGVFWGMPTLAFPGKMALLIFLTAIGIWVSEKVDATLVALLAAFAMWAAGLTGGEKVLSGLGDPFIAFVVAGFMLGGAFKVAGLSDRVAHWFARRSGNTAQLFYRLTTALILLSFVIPSTSARAALLMPVYVAISGALANDRAKKALAVLFPVTIVLSCVTSYLGAGANLMTADFIARFSGEHVTYLQWLMLGGPFGVVSCYASTAVILRVFLNREERRAPFRLETPDENKAEQPALQRRVLFVSTLLMILWMSEPWHGIDAGMAALCGALVLCLPNTGVLTFKQAIKEVEWSLVIFMAATIELGKGLVGSGAVDYVMQSFATLTVAWSGYAILTLVFAVALLSHLLIHSRTARAAVLMPLLIPVGMAAGHSGLLVAFFANAAMGYCLTLPVCAKPVAMFSTVDGSGYSSADLIRLSIWLLPLHLVLILLFFMAYATL